MIKLLQVAITAGLLGLLIRILINWKLHCPKCRRLFAARVIGKTILDESPTEEVAWDDATGQDVRREAVLRTVQYTYTCRDCAHEWTHTKSEQ